MENYVKTDKLNINYIKQLLYEENQKYLEIDTERRKLSDEIFNLERLSASITKPEFNICREIAPDLYKLLDKKIDSKNKKLKSIEYNISFETKTKYLEIMRCFKEYLPINNEQFFLLVDLFERKQFSDKEKIILLEHVRMNNIIANLKMQNRKINYNKLYEVINIANAGYETFEDVHIESDRKPEMNNIIELFKSYFQSMQIENVLDLLPTYKSNLTFTSGFSVDDFDYIMTNILNFVRDELFKAGNEIINFKNYKDRELRTLLVDQYYEYLNTYNIIRNNYDNSLNKYNRDYSSFDEITKEIPNKKNILFASNSIDGESFFKKDLKEINSESYDSISKLLVMFQKDILPITGFKALNEAFPGMLEIRNDQIRITLFHNENNNYVITGVFTKKSDIDRSEYSKRYNRQTGNYIILDESYNDSIINFLDENKRTGGRAKSKIKINK